MRRVLSAFWAVESARLVVALGASMARRWRRRFAPKTDAAMSDSIFVHNLEFVGKHGVYEDERRDGRRFAVDVRVETATLAAGTSDALAETVDYRDLAAVVMEVGHGPSVQLIETMAEQICGRILANHRSISLVELRIRKYATGVPGEPEWVGIEVVRERGA